MVTTMVADGLRYTTTTTTTVTVGPSAHPLFAPTSYINAPIPANVAIDPITPQAQARLVTASHRGGGPTINYDAWSQDIYIGTPDTPRVPVLLDHGWGTNPPPNKKPLIALCAQGVPIPPEHAANVARRQAANDSDLAFVIYLPATDELWELWRLKQLPDGSWTAAEGGHMCPVSTNVGHWKENYVGATYSTLPTTAVKQNLYQHRDWGVSAAKLPMLGLTITREDVAQGRIDHAIGLNLPNSDLLRRPASQVRWPAQASDGIDNLASPLEEGLLLQVPPEFDTSVLHPFARLIADGGKTHPLVVKDRGDNIAFQAENGVQAAWEGTLRADVLAGFPWGQLRVLMPGSDAAPFPVGG